MTGVKLFWAVVPLAAALGCQSTGTIAGNGSVPDPAPSRAAEFSAAELSHGRMLYANKCAKCHKFYDPAGYDNAEWKMWMRKMSRKAHLTNEEEVELARYLGLYRPARTPTAGS